jgi:hypothetical protein
MDQYNIIMNSLKGFATAHQTAGKNPTNTRAADLNIELQLQQEPPDGLARQWAVKHLGQLMPLLPSILAEIAPPVQQEQQQQQQPFQHAALPPHLQTLATVQQQQNIGLQQQQQEKQQQQAQAAALIAHQQLEAAKAALAAAQHQVTSAHQMHQSHHVSFAPSVHPPAYIGGLFGAADQNANTIAHQGVAAYILDTPVGAQTMHYGTETPNAHILPQQGVAAHTLDTPGGAQTMHHGTVNPYAHILAQPGMAAQTLAGQVGMASATQLPLGGVPMGATAIPGFGQYSVFPPGYPMLGNPTGWGQTSFALPHHFQHLGVGPYPFGTPVPVVADSSYETINIPTLCAYMGFQFLPVNPFQQGMPESLPRMTKLSGAAQNNIHYEEIDSFSKNEENLQYFQGFEFSATLPSEFKKDGLRM